MKARGRRTNKAGSVCRLSNGHDRILFGLAQPLIIPFFGYKGADRPS